MAHHDPSLITPDTRIWLFKTNPKYYSHIMKPVEGGSIQQFIQNNSHVCVHYKPGMIVDCQSLAHFATSTLFTSILFFNIPTTTTTSDPLRVHLSTSSLYQTGDIAIVWLTGDKGKGQLISSYYTIKNIETKTQIQDAMIEDIKENEGHSFRLLDGSNRSVCPPTIIPPYSVLLFTLRHPSHTPITLLSHLIH